MRKKGQIAQIIMSVPTLIGVFIIMSIFVIIAGFFGGSDDFIGKQDISNSAIESAVLAKRFLGDVITREDFMEKRISDNGDISVFDLIHKNIPFFGKERIEILQERFDEKYSCGGINKFEVRKFQFRSIYKYVEINYPETFPDFNFPIELTEVKEIYPYKPVKGTETGFCDGFPGSAGSHTKTYTQGMYTCIYIEAVTLC
ncbi:MAG: hypothetical protein Q8P57_02250 [Candidatus Pacearchaeota archaeon]|nr:hypothetical protein [Candidatus Pacearchaeota archaeon]